MAGERFKLLDNVVWNKEPAIVVKINTDRTLALSFLGVIVIENIPPKEVAKKFSNKF